MRLLILTVISNAAVKAISLYEPLHTVRSKVKEEVNKELEQHQLQSGACAPPPPFYLLI